MKTEKIYQCHRSLLLVLTCALIMLAPIHAAGAGSHKMMAVSFGDGSIGLFWPPSASMYTSGGWQLQDTRTGKTVARWRAEDLARNLQTLPRQQQEKLRPFFADLKKSKSGKERASMVSWLLMGGMTDFNAACKLGMAIHLKDVPAGKRSYRLFQTNSHGKRTGKSIVSIPVNSGRATPLPAGVTNVRGRSGDAGMELYWDRIKKKTSMIPAPLIVISRTGADGTAKNITPDPVWLSPDRDVDSAAYIDTRAPLEAKLTYAIRRMDIFGRLSDPVEVTVFNEDIAALYPPEKITARAEENEVELHWQPKENPYTSGYVIERSRRCDGIYEVLTPGGLDRDTDSYTDKNLKGGFVYYYRVRTMGPRGDVGPAPDPVSVMVKTDGAPDSPEGLAATVEPTRVLLHWRPMPLPVAGYIVEKKKEDNDTWVRINSRLATRPALEDPINLGDYGKRQYRVIAVAFGNAKSDPGDEITVTLPGHPLLPPPTLTDIRIEDGAVHLRFQAGKPQDRTKKMLLVRGNDIRDMGLVVNKDIDGDETDFTDTMVKPGEDYWYGLIALDADGHRSKMSNKLFVIVGSAEIPRPDRPDAKLAKKPFRRVTITFDKPEGFLRVSVMRKIDNGPWTTIGRDITGTDSAVDADPPLSGTVRYRVAYLDESNTWGEPSKPVALEMGE